MIYGYLRVSYDEQDVNSQKQGVAKFAEAHEWTIDEARKQNAFHEFVESNDKNKPKGGIVKECFNEGNGSYKVNLAYLNEEQVKEIEGLVKKWNPELKEIDDEKIRKELIAFLKENHETGRADETWSLSGIERWIVWLEKQESVKQNPTEWSKEDKKILGELINFLVNMELPAIYASWLKSLRPQNTWKPSDEQMKAFENFVRGIWESCYDSPYENNAKLLYSLLEQLKKLK